MRFLTRLLQSIRCQLSAVSCQLCSPTPEPDFAALNDRGHWLTDVPRGRWVAGL